MKRLWVLFLLLTFCLSVNGQTNKSKELIVGRWDLVETIKDTTDTGFEPLLDLSTDDPETVSQSDPQDKEVVFFFTSEGEFQDKYHGQQYRDRYRFLSDDIVIIGKRTYQIIEITRQKLKIQSYEDDEFLSLNEPDILIFQKSEEPFKLIGEYQDHLSHYSDGQKKEEGTYHNGNPHDLWKVWYPNGQLKSQRTFRDGLPIGTFVYYHLNGQKKEEGTFNAYSRQIGVWKTWDEQGKLVEETNWSK